MEIIQYIHIIRRWLWLLVIGAIIGGSASFMFYISQPRMYNAQSLIAIGGFIQAPNPDQQEVRIGFDLTETYAQLVRTQDVLEATLDNLEIDLTTDELNNLLVTRILPNTSLLQLNITYTDPILSADLVNMIANQLILASPSNLTPEQQSQVDLLNEQIASITQEITDLRGQLTSLDAQLSDSNINESQREELQLTRTTLINLINQSSSNIAQFTNTIASLQERTNSVEIVENARIPQEPEGQRIVTLTILGVILGGGLAFGVALVYEYLNDTFHNSEEVSQSLKQPILGVISSFGNKDDGYDNQLITNKLTERVFDEFRILRTNVLFPNMDKSQIYLVTSALPSEGKSIISANLAVSMALSGLRVLLIDADMRRPSTHKIFNLDNTHGLSSLLTLVPTLKNTRVESKEDLGETKPIQDYVERMQGSPQMAYSPDTWKQVIQTPESLQNLRVITAGFAVENPTELLGSTLMRRWMAIINNKTHFDIVLIDTAPSLGFPDATVIATSLDAKVLLVVQAERTHRDVAKKVIQRLEHVKSNIVGVIFNRANQREENYYGENYDYYYRS